MLLLVPRRVVLRVVWLGGGFQQLSFSHPFGEDGTYGKRPKRKRSLSNHLFLRDYVELVGVHPLKSNIDTKNGHI